MTTTKIHDSATCTAGAHGGKCEMCQFASKSPPESFPGYPRPSEGVKTSLTDREGAKTALLVVSDTADFDHEWSTAPRSMTNYVEQQAAEFWFLRGQRAGKLNQMIEENRVFRSMAELRGLL